MSQRIALPLVLLLALSSTPALAAAAPAPPAPRSAKATKSAPDPAREREKSILDAKNVVLGQLAASGAGSWDEWNASVEPFRVALRARIATATPNNPKAKGPTEGRYEVLESLGAPPRFEAWPSNYLRYLANAPLSTSDFISQTAFVSSIDAISRWLASRGIDLIFVPVPKMTEVYPDQFIRETPADRIVAPQMRRAIHDLLDRGVEVVDVLPVFLEARKKAGPSLYQFCDPHWTWEGQRIALEEIVKRLQRYPVVRKAQSGPHLYRSFTERRDVSAVSAALGALTPEQAKRVKPLLAYDVELVQPVGNAPLTSETSPIALAGDSYNNGLEANLSYRLNLPIRDLHASGSSSPFKDLLRDPESMKSMKVLIYLVSTPGLWEYPAKLPGEIGKFVQEPAGK
ncbi:MAG TPA: hypothetical protein VE129_14175 [Thermoanaerobaculia bacterium]|nr:hypothetical protein [Thermoanaerobaculia bacterium]